MAFMKNVDTVFMMIGLVIILIGFWMFKGFVIESASVTKMIFMKYKYDWITGMILILFGSAVMGLPYNERFKKFIEGIRNAR